MHPYRKFSRNDFGVHSSTPPRAPENVCILRMLRREQAEYAAYLGCELQDCGLRRVSEASSCTFSILGIMVLCTS